MVRSASPIAVILVGRPGCGKSYHAQTLEHRYGFERLEMGGVIRELWLGDFLDSKQKSLMAEGRLLPDPDILRIFCDHMGRLREEGVSRVVIDGVPRNITQVQECVPCLRELGFGRIIAFHLCLENPRRLAESNLTKDIIGLTMLRILSS